MAKFFMIFAALVALVAASPLENIEGDTVRNTRSLFKGSSGIGMGILSSAISSALAERGYGGSGTPSSLSGFGRIGDSGDDLAAAATISDPDGLDDSSISLSFAASTSSDSSDRSTISASPADSASSGDPDDSAASSVSSSPTSRSDSSGFGGRQYTQTFRYSGPRVGGLGLGYGLGADPAQRADPFGYALSADPSQRAAPFGYASAVDPAQRAAPFGYALSADPSQRAGPFGYASIADPSQRAGPFGYASIADPVQSAAPYGKSVVQYVSSPPQIIECVVENPPIIEVVVPERQPCPTPVIIESMTPRKKKKKC